MTRTPSSIRRPSRPHRRPTGTSPHSLSPQPAHSQPSHRAGRSRRSRVAGTVLLLAVGGAALVVLPAGESTSASPVRVVAAQSQALPAVVVPRVAPRVVRRASRGGARTALPPVRYVRRTVPVGAGFTGAASWYGGSFQGRRTASGEVFDTNELTAASRTLPFGTRLRVCRRTRCVVVRVNDRGPYVSGRVLDLTRAAVDALGYDGVAVVSATPVATRTVAVQLPAPPAPKATPAAARPAARASTAPPLVLPPPTPVLASSSTSDADSGDAPTAVLVAALAVLGAAGLVRARSRRTGDRACEARP